MALIFIAFLTFMLIGLLFCHSYGCIETQQFTTSVAIIAPLLIGTIALFQDQLRKSLFQPKFVFSISNEDIHFHPTAHGKSPVYYLHLRVQNKGARAKCCQIMLMAVKKEIEGTYQIETTRDPLQLAWSITHFVNHDFATGQWRNLDIGFIENHSADDVNSSRDPRLLKHAFHYAVSHKLNAYPNGFNSGKVRLLVSLFMEDHNPLHKAIEIEYTGLWKDTLDEMREELTARLL
jgi:hypothetical protein